ncbi:MAG: hypothetical protein ACRDPF_23590, partial [Streptosporangiaceae bacterium]
ELTDALASRPGPWAVERTMDAFQDKWPRWRRRDLDDEATLVGGVMEATPTVTVGPVTVGPHA